MVQTRNTKLKQNQIIFYDQSRNISIKLWYKIYKNHQSLLPNPKQTIHDSFQSTVQVKTTFPQVEEIWISVEHQQTQCQCRYHHQQARQDHHQQQHPTHQEATKCIRMWVWVLTANRIPSELPPPGSTLSSIYTRAISTSRVKINYFIGTRPVWANGGYLILAAGSHIVSCLFGTIEVLVLAFFFPK